MRIYKVTDSISNINLDDEIHGKYVKGIYTHNDIDCKTPQFLTMVVESNKPLWWYIKNVAGIKKWINEVDANIEKLLAAGDIETVNKGLRRTEP